MSGGGILGGNQIRVRERFGGNTKLGALSISLSQNLGGTNLNKIYWEGGSHLSDLSLISQPPSSALLSRSLAERRPLSLGLGLGVRILGCSWLGSGCSDLGVFGA
jgi:hypothetical protein